MASDSRIILKTERLKLRTWTDHYGDLLHTHCNTQAVMEHLGGVQSPAKHREMVRWLIEDQQKPFGTTFWVVERQNDGGHLSGEFLGFCGLVKVDEADSTVLGATEIGWRLRQDAQGKGYAKEAATACLHYAFRELDGLRVVSRTVDKNEPSWGLMERLGMRRDRRLNYVPEEGGDPFIVYVATYEDWKKIKKAHPDTAASA